MGHVIQLLPVGISVIPSVILKSPGLQFVDVTHKSFEALKSHSILVFGPASVVHSSVALLLNVAMTLSGIISVKPAGETTKRNKEQMFGKDNVLKFTTHLLQQP